MAPRNGCDLCGTTWEGEVGDKCPNGCTRYGSRVHEITDKPQSLKTGFPYVCSKCGVHHTHIDSVTSNGCVVCRHYTPEIVDKTQSCLAAQQGGNHYQQGAIQPIEYIHANKLNFFEGNCVKYVTRNRRKGAPVEDLKKAVHYLQLQLKLEHGIDSRIEYDAVSRD